MELCPALSIKFILNVSNLSLSLFLDLLLYLGNQTLKEEKRTKEVFLQNEDREEKQEEEEEKIIENENNRR